MVGVLSDKNLAAGREHFKKDLALRDGDNLLPFDLGELKGPETKKPVEGFVRIAAAAAAGTAMFVTSQGQAQVIGSQSNVAASKFLGNSVAYNGVNGVATPTVAVIVTRADSTTSTFSGVLANMGGHSTVITAQHGFFNNPGFSKIEVVLGTNFSTGIRVEPAAVAHAAYNGTWTNGSLDLTFLRLGQYFPTSGDYNVTPIVSRQVVTSAGFMNWGVSGGTMNAQTGEISAVQGQVSSFTGSQFTPGTHKAINFDSSSAGLLNGQIVGGGSGGGGYGVVNNEYTLQSITVAGTFNPDLSTPAGKMAIAPFGGRNHSINLSDPMVSAVVYANINPIPEPSHVVAVCAIASLLGYKIISKFKESIL